MRPWAETLVAWSLAFITAEALGFVVSLLLSSIISEATAVSLGQAATVVVRVAAIIFLASKTGVTLSSIYRSPLPTRTPVLVAATISVGILAYAVNLASSSNGPSVIQYSSFQVDAAVWTVPFALAYYLSEVVMLNYLYILAKRSLSLRGSHSLAAAVFLVVGWASLHAITQNLVTAIFAVALIPILYGSYEYTGQSPLTPILLWFVTLVF